MKGVNNIKRTIKEDRVFSDLNGMVDATVSFKQGDQLWFDSATGLVKPLIIETEGASSIGVAVVSVTNGVQDGPYTGLTDTSPKAGVVAGPVFGVEVEVTLKTGDALLRGGLVYGTTDATILSSAGTKAIGLYVGPVDIAAAVAGQKIIIRQGARYPQDTLRL